LHQDPALWPLNLSTNRIEREKYLDKGHVFFQNKDSDFKTSKRDFGKQNRYFSSNYFQRKLNNGEIENGFYFLNLQEQFFAMPVKYFHQIKITHL